MTQPPQPPEQDGPTSGLPSYGSFDPPAGETPPPPPPPGDGAIPPAPGGYGPAPENNKKALWSMILGILSILCCGLFAGIPAIILSTIAKKEIAESGGRQGGSGMATAGLILGIVSIAFSLIYILLLISGTVSM